jgi:hypothetical protein
VRGHFAHYGPKYDRGAVGRELEMAGILVGHPPPAGTAQLAPPSTISSRSSAAAISSRASSTSSDTRRSEERATRRRRWTPTIRVSGVMGQPGCRERRRIR